MRNNKKIEATILLAATLCFSFSASAYWSQKDESLYQLGKIAVEIDAGKNPATYNKDLMPNWSQFGKKELLRVGGIPWQYLEWDMRQEAFDSTRAILANGQRKYLVGILVKLAICDSKFAKYPSTIHPAVKDSFWLPPLKSLSENNTKKTEVWFIEHTKKLPINADQFPRWTSAIRLYAYLLYKHPELDQNSPEKLIGLYNDYLKTKNISELLKHENGYDVYTDISSTDLFLISTYIALSKKKNTSYESDIDWDSIAQKRLKIRTKRYAKIIRYREYQDLYKKKLKGEKL